MYRDRGLHGDNFEGRIMKLAKMKVILNHMLLEFK